MTEPMANQAVPVCPRHLDRVSYVRCQRCGRPTCPECQRPAAVGVQCVDCVREGQRSVRAPRTQFGAAVRDGRPVVTLTIIGICTAVWLLQQVSPTVTQELSFAPYQGVSEPWRFLTAAFAHAQGQPLHILFNMFALYQIGSYLEPMLGRVRFASLYLISALGGSVGYLLLATPPGSVDDLPGQRVGHRHGRGLGGRVRPLRRPARAEPAPRPVLGRHRRRPRHQRRPRLRHPGHRLAGAPRRGDHRRRAGRA